MQKSNFFNPPQTPSGTTAVEMGSRLRTWRRSAKLTQDELAAQLELSTDTLRRYESGINMMSASALTVLYAHGVNMNWLITGERPMMRPQDGSEEETAIHELVQAMRELRVCHPDSFAMLVKGFIARSKEAIRLSELERKVAFQDHPRMDAPQGWGQGATSEQHADLILPPSKRVGGDH